MVARRPANSPFPLRNRQEVGRRNRRGRNTLEGFRCADGNRLVCRRTLYARRSHRSADSGRHVAAAARWRPQACAAAAHSSQRGPRCVLSRTGAAALDRLSIGRKRVCRSLRNVDAGRAIGEMADLEWGWGKSTLAKRRARTLLHFARSANRHGRRNRSRAAVSPRRAPHALQASPPGRIGGHL